MTDQGSAVTPDWKAAFLSKPSISTRKGIAFNFDPPREDTSTLVLTAPSGRFVDIRFPVDTAYDESGQPIPTQSNPSFWAFSGASETTFYDAHRNVQPGFSYTAHMKFMHDIDSKGPDIPDEGDCFTLPNGDVMEVGIWPENGFLYKEMWSDPDILPGRTTVLKAPVVVIETETSRDNTSSRGIMIRVGDYIQGIWESRSTSNNTTEIFVQRLTRISGGDHPDAPWQWRAAPQGRSIDDTLLPGEKLIQIPNDIRLEYAIESDGGVWHVTEFTEAVPGA